MPEPSRNDPCPCGSGKKYKKCCMFKVRPQPGPEELARAKLVQELMDYAGRYHKDVLPEAFDWFWGGESPDEKFLREFDTGIKINFSEWLLMDYPAAPETGRTIVELYRESRKNLTEPEMTVLDRFRESTLSLFEVQEIFPEKGIVLKDLLLGGEYQVWEKSVTRGVVKWDILAVRLILIDGRYIICGSVYPYAARRKPDLLAAIRKEYEDYKKEAPDAMLRKYLKADGAIFNILWYKETTQDARPGLLTRTGEPLMFCRAAFAITDQAKVAGLLKKHDQLEADDEGAFIWSEDPGRDGALVLGSVRIIKKELVLECMSKKRLEQGKQMILKTLSGLVEHKTDEFRDPYEVLATNQKKAKPASEIPLEIRQQLYDKFQREHMEKWLDEKIPALDGLTPRECVKTEAGREKVANLLKSFENMEERKRKAGEPYHDHGWIWPKLGLERPE